MPRFWYSGTSANVLDTKPSLLPNNFTAIRVPFASSRHVWDQRSCNSWSRPIHGCLWPHSSDILKQEPMRESLAQCWKKLLRCSTVCLKPNHSDYMIFDTRSVMFDMSRVITSIIMVNLLLTFKRLKKNKNAAMKNARMRIPRVIPSQVLGSQLFSRLHDFRCFFLGQISLRGKKQIGSDSDGILVAFIRWKKTF